MNGLSVGLQQSAPRPSGDLLNPAGGRGRLMAAQVGVFVMLPVTGPVDNNGRRVIGGGHSRGGGGACQSRGDKYPSGMHILATR